jgi:hypothetical protein
MTEPIYVQDLLDVAALRAEIAAIREAAAALAIIEQQRMRVNHRLTISGETLTAIVNKRRSR